MEKEAKHEDFYIREDGVKVYMLPGEEEKIEVPVDELPPVADIDNALKVLIAPLRFWLYLAVRAPLWMPLRSLKLNTTGP